MSTSSSRRILPGTVWAARAWTLDRGGPWLVLPPIAGEVHPLLELLRRGCEEEAAMEELLRRLYRPLHRVIGRHVHPSVTHDVVIDALMKVSRHSAKCRARTDAEVVAWANTIARNCGRDTYRSRSVKNEQVYAAGKGRNEAAIDFDQEPTPKPLMARLEQLHSDLCIEAQTLLWLRLIQGDPWEDIAKHLSTTPAGAKRRFQRVLRRLRDRMIEELGEKGTDYGTNAVR